MLIYFSNQGNQYNSPGSVVTPVCTINVGDTVLVVAVSDGGLVSSITDDGGNPYFRAASPASNGALTVEIWAAIRVVNPGTILTVTFANSGNISAEVSTYHNVNSLGNTAVSSGSSTSPSISVGTEDNNNFIVAGLGCPATEPGFNFWSPNVGNLRTSAQAQYQTGGALVDNTAATPSSVTCSATLSTSAAWAACALELRSGVADPPAIPAQDDAVLGYSSTAVTWQEE